MEKGRKEPHIEGLANHDAPESCAGVREGAGEALTGVGAGWAIEPRNADGPGCRRRRKGRKAKSPAALSRAAGGPRAVREPVHARDLSMRENREVPHSLAMVMEERAARGRPRP